MIRAVAIFLGLLALVLCWPVAAALLGVGLLVTAGSGMGRDQ